MSVANQTVLPKKFILFDDGEKKDLRNIPLYKYIFEILNHKQIEWQVVYGDGFVPNQQHALEMAETEWVWRLDDDNIAESNVLEILLSNAADDVGAVAGCVYHPGMINPPVPTSLRKIKDIFRNSGNIQWCKFDDKIEMDSLYSTFIYRTIAGRQNGCFTNLSPAGHREDTLFTHQIKRNGWKLIIDPKAVTWHLRNPDGGIRTFNKHPEYWANDDEFLKKKLNEWGIESDKRKIIILNNGLGDHLVLKSVLPDIIEKNKDKEIFLASCVPEIFNDIKGITLISIAEAQMFCANSGLNMDDFSVYHFCAKNNWTKHFSEAYKALYLSITPPTRGGACN
jgi:hypothetical protein